MPGIIQTLKQLHSEGVEGYFAIKYAELAKDKPIMREFYANIADRVAVVIGEGTLLEVGPGPASVSIEIAKRITRVNIVGLDISTTMVVIGRQKIAKAGFSKRITLLQGNAIAMPFEDAKFDFIISSGSLHLWNKPIKVFEEIYRVLKPGQLALIYDVRKDTPKEKVDESSRNINSWFIRWGLKHSISKSCTLQNIEEILSRTHFKEAHRIKPDGLGVFIWLQKPPSQTS
jgi:ubiquinone/menaquinone biosynthesis C-methylase UbiE